VELLKDTAVRWRSLRRLRESPAFAAITDPAIAAELSGPDAEIYVIDVSFAAMNDQAEAAYLKDLPTSFVLPTEAVDRLRAAAGTIIMASAEFQRLLKDTGATIVSKPPDTKSEPKSH
jgi:NTE family protein